DDRLDAQQHRALGGPVPRRTGAVLLAGQHDQRHAFGGVGHRGVVDGALVAGQVVDGDPALDPGYQLVAQPDVGERAADHHLVVAAPRPVRVEVALVHPVRREVFPGGRVRLDGTGRRDVVGGHRVAELRQYLRAFDVLTR